MGLVHAGILNVLPGVQLAALCEKSNLTRKFSRKIFKGIEIVDDVAKLSKLNLDAVYVTTPIPSHFSIAKTVFEDRITSNLFVEKTLAQTYEESKQLSKMAHAFGGVNMVGYLRRFCVTFNKARDLLMKGTIGNATSFKAYAYSSDFLGVEKESKTSASRGGVLKDLGCHAVDLALWFFGDLQVSSVRLSPGASHAEDFANFKVKNSDIEGEFDVSWRVEDYRLPEVGFSIAGSKGKLDVNDDRVRLTAENGESHLWYRHDLGDNVPFWLALPEYYREDSYYVKSIMEAVKAEPDFYAGREVDRIIGEVEKKAGETD